jgi:antitoxin FitA
LIVPGWVEQLFERLARRKWILFGTQRVATLAIRDLDDEVKARLRLRAAEHGRSMEAEARSILANAVNNRRPARGLGSYIADRFAKLGGVELEVPPRSEPARAAEFDS